MTDLLEPPQADDAPSTEPVATGSDPAKLAILAGLLGLAGIFGGVSMVIVILSIVVMIFLHELGHYLAARWGGMKVTEFFIGFGPRIWSFQKGETEYGIKAIPAGAYVKVIGMNSLHDEDHEPHEEHRTYRQASFPKRFILAVAGSTMHFVQALICLFILFAIVGAPANAVLSGDDLDPYRGPLVIDSVVEDSAAEAAGLRAGDIILAFNGVDFVDFTELAAAVRAVPGEDAVVTVSRDGAVLDLVASVGSVDSEDGPQGSLGVTRQRPDYPDVTLGVGDAAIESVDAFGASTSEIIGFLGRFFSLSGLSDFGDTLTTATTDNDTVGNATGGSGSGDVTERPISLIGAVRLGADFTEEGLNGFLAFYASINITIGIVNLLPFPPLDGGHVVVAVYERIREGRSKKRYIADYARVIPVAYAMFVVLMLVFVTTAYLDILDAV